MKLIVNADDFGLCREVNRAVQQAHRHGILTSASLMVTGSAATEAIEIAKDNPGLRVGLHIVLGCGRSALKAEQIPHLVDCQGAFPRSAFRVGLRYWFDRAAKDELARELRAQFELFAASGLPLSHVDGHMDLHVHPTVFDLLVPLLREFKAGGFRLPQEPLWAALHAGSIRAISRTPASAILWILSRRCERRLAQCKLAMPRRSYGLLHSGSMSEQYLLSLLPRINHESAEIYFHPTTAERVEQFGPNPGDLAALLSPAVRRVIDQRGMELTTYAGIHRLPETQWAHGC